MVFILKYIFQHLLSKSSLSKFLIVSTSSFWLMGSASLPNTLLTANLSSKLPYQSTLSINNHKVYTEVVDNNKTRARGLMFRQSLPQEAGMLFVFQDEQPRCFWMKNTSIPLSIAYINSQGEIFDIFDLQPHDETSVCSTQPAMFALEVNQGWFSQKGITIGDKIHMDSPIRK